MSISRRTILKLAGLTPFAGVAYAQAETGFQARQFAFRANQISSRFQAFRLCQSERAQRRQSAAWRSGSFDSFNGFIIKGDPAAGIGLTLETLTTQSSDEVGAEYGLIAETIYHPEDYSSAAFRLRPEARWHDGMPMTAEDVIYGFKFLKDNNPQYQFYYKNVEKVEQTGDREVTFFFDSKGNRELPQIMGQVTVLPKHYWEGNDATGNTATSPTRRSSRRSAPGNTGSRASTPGSSSPTSASRTIGARILPCAKGKTILTRSTICYFLDRTCSSKPSKAIRSMSGMGAGTKEWETQYDFPAVKKRTIVKTTFYTKDARAHAGLRLQPAPREIRRSPGAPGLQSRL